MIKASSVYMCHVLSCLVPKTFISIENGCHSVSPFPLYTPTHTPTPTPTPHTHSTQSTLITSTHKSLFLSTWYDTTSNNVRTVTPTLARGASHPHTSHKIPPPHGYCLHWQGPKLHWPRLLKTSKTSNQIETLNYSALRWCPMVPMVTRASLRPLCSLRRPH